MTKQKFADFNDWLRILNHAFLYCHQNKVEVARISPHEVLFSDWSVLTVEELFDATHKHEREKHDFPDESRIDIIGSNGATVEHYKSQLVDGQWVDVQEFSDDE